MLSVQSRSQKEILNNTNILRSVCQMSNNGTTLCYDDCCCPSKNHSVLQGKNRIYEGEGKICIRTPGIFFAVLLSKMELSKQRKSKSLWSLFPGTL